MNDLTCREFVELVTDYLEGALAPVDQVRFEEHLALCPGCEAYLEQMRLTLRMAGRLREDSIAPDARKRLLDAFRAWKRKPAE